MKNIVTYVFLTFISITMACSQNLGKVDKAVKSQLNSVLTSYYGVKDALVATDAKKSKTEAAKLSEVLAKVETAKLTEDQRKFYAPLAENLKKAADQIAASEDVEVQRKHFETASIQLYSLMSTFKANSATAYQQFCPMAFDDKGAFWLSDRKEVKNPYFGSKMLKCGSVKSEF